MNKAEKTRLLKAIEKSLESNLYLATDRPTIPKMAEDIFKVFGFLETEFEFPNQIKNDKELKDCKACGSEAMEINLNNKHMICCDNMGCDHMTDGFDTLIEARISWNTQI